MRVELLAGRSHDHPAQFHTQLIGQQTPLPHQLPRHRMHAPAFAFNEHPDAPVSLQGLVKLDLAFLDRFCGFCFTHGVLRSYSSATAP